MQGTKWYRTTTGSSLQGTWGFADGGSSITIDDNGSELETSDGDKRISWYVNNIPNTDTHAGGYRCGTSTGINNSPDWEKVFYHGNAADTTPTTGLI